MTKDWWPKKWWQEWTLTLTCAHKISAGDVVDVAEEDLRLVIEAGTAVGELVSHPIGADRLCTGEIRTVTRVPDPALARSAEPCTCRPHRLIAQGDPVGMCIKCGGLVPLDVSAPRTGEVLTPANARTGVEYLYPAKSEPDERFVLKEFHRATGSWLCTDGSCVALDDGRYRIITSVLPCLYMGSHGAGDKVPREQLPKGHSSEDAKRFRKWLGHEMRFLRCDDPPGTTFEVPGVVGVYTWLGVPAGQPKGHGEAISPSGRQICTFMDEDTRWPVIAIGTAPDEFLARYPALKARHLETMRPDQERPATDVETAPAAPHVRPGVAPSAEKREIWRAEFLRCPLLRVEDCVPGATYATYREGMDFPVMQTLNEVLAPQLAKHLAEDLADGFDLRLVGGPVVEAEAPEGNATMPAGEEAECDVCEALIDEGETYWTQTDRHGTESPARFCRHQIPLVSDCVRCDYDARFFASEQNERARGPRDSGPSAADGFRRMELAMRKFIVHLTKLGLPADPRRARLEAAGFRVDDALTETGASDKRTWYESVAGRRR